MVSVPLPVMFRAGRAAGETPHAFDAAAMSFLAPRIIVPGVVLLADISQFQREIVAAYFAWSRAVIFRAMYGTTVDKAWYGGERRSFIHDNGAKFTGIYQYVTAFQNVLAQADALGNLLGSLKPGEKIIADIEEGAGSQQARWVQWATRVAQLGDDPWDYSGANYARDHGLQPVDWIAAYGTREPDPPHKLWQFTDAFTVPGIAGAVDCSVYHGSIDDLAALAYQPAKPPPPPPPPAEEPMLVLGNALVSGGPAAVLPVPAGKHTVIFYADPGYQGGTVPSVRVIFDVGGPQTVSPVWGTPVWLKVPAGAARLSVARLDAGDVPVTVDFA